MAVTDQYSAKLLDIHVNINYSMRNASMLVLIVAAFNSLPLSTLAVQG